MTIKIIGIGDNGKESLPALYETFIAESECLIGGERHLAFFPEYKGEKIVIKGGLAPLIEHLQSTKKNIVVLASGDPLFFGIGSYITKKVKAEVYPNVSSVQLAFAKIGERWQDAAFITVHGRTMKGLAQKIDGHEAVAILTDDTNTPAKIASYLLEYGMNEYKMFVAENLGGTAERTGWYPLEKANGKTFSPLNIVILKQVDASPNWPLGIEDKEFFQRKPEKGLITKKEVRTLSIASLRLKENSIVWDIGTCTGSMAIEAARIARKGEVFAIEKNEADLANCYENMKKFRTDFTVVHGKAPDHLHNFKDPDAVFIGGTAGGMDAILQVCCKRLKDDGRIVVNVVTLESLQEAIHSFEKYGFKTEITLCQISRSQPILHLTRFAALNPIYIITGNREKDE